MSSNHQAANFDQQTYEAAELHDLVKQAQTASVEYAAIAALEKHIESLKASLVARKTELQKPVHEEHLKSLTEHAKTLGYNDVQEMANALGLNASANSKTGDAAKKPARTSPKAPKVFGHVRRDDATGVTADDPIGYVRLPEHQAKSGKYRVATADEKKKMQAELDAWEAQYGSAKKP